MSFHQDFGFSSSQDSKGEQTQKGGFFAAGLRVGEGTSDL